MRDERLREREIQRMCVHLIRALGGEAYPLDQGRTTRNAPGLPDCWMFLPNDRGGLWLEAKSFGGKPSPPQLDFEAHCVRSGVPYVRGGATELSAYLRAVGIL